VSREEPVLTIKQHRQVYRALPIVGEEAEGVAMLLGWSLDDPRLEDFRSIGKLALYDAVTRLDEQKGSLEKFGRYRVRGAILDNVRAEAARARIEVQMARAVAYRMCDYWDDFNILQHDETECERRLHVMLDSALAVMFAAGVEQAQRDTAEDAVAAREEYARAMAVLKEVVLALRPDERALLDMLFGCGFDQIRAAERLGVHKDTAWLRLKRLLARLKVELEKRLVTAAPAPRDDVPVSPVLRAQHLRLVPPETDDA
jgi:RNA polymerase sigma factor (sigma-70 family)